MNTLAAETASAWYLTLKGNPIGAHAPIGNRHEINLVITPHLPRTPDAGDRTGLRWRGCHNSAASFIACAAGLPPSLWRAVRKVSLSPRVLIAPDMPPIRGTGPLIAPKQLVHHLLAVSSSRRPALAHTRVMYLFCRVFGCQRSAKEKSPS